MIIRSVRIEFEAKLAAADAHRATGKIECKAYGDGERALRARLRDLDDVAPDCSLRLFVNDRMIGDLQRTRNKAELKLDSRLRDAVPNVSAGDQAEIRCGELIVSRGRFYED